METNASTQSIGCVDSCGDPLAGLLVHGDSPWLCVSSKIWQIIRKGAPAAPAAAMLARDVPAKQRR